MNIYNLCILNGSLSGYLQPQQVSLNDGHPLVIIQISFFTMIN